jgi:formylglycine-generating enzyme required for sulfatase activity
MSFALDLATACLLVFAPACSPEKPVYPTTAGAQLSLAADHQMVMIPAGAYIAGSTPEERAAAYDDYAATSGQDSARVNHWFDSEEDRHRAELRAFRIDLMPVTNGEYAELVATGTVSAPAIVEQSWKSQGFSQPYDTVLRFVWKTGQPPPGRMDHPVVLVTWQEADRYCRWRGEARGERRRLPTAAEFEKAARGDAGIAYPWGNVFEPDKLDSAVGGPGDTMPVGSYIGGASPYGVLDMAGEVFEWTSTPFAPGEMTVKGSAWEDFAGVGRGAARHGRPIGARHVIVGFRCAADA